MAVLDTDEAVQDAPQRIDGRAKIMGRGTYTADLTDATLRPYLHAGETAKSMLYAVTVPSTIARGMVTAIDATMAFAVDGVVAVLTHENATKLHAVKSLVSSEQTKFLPSAKRRSSLPWSTARGCTCETVLRLRRRQQHWSGSGTRKNLG